MREFVVIASLFGSSIIMLLSLNAIDPIVMFILFGIIPGSDEAVSASQMLLMYGVAGGIILSVVLQNSIKGIISLLTLVRRQPVSPRRSRA